MVFMVLRLLFVEVNYLFWMWGCVCNLLLLVNYRWLVCLDWFVCVVVLSCDFV